MTHTPKKVIRNLPTTDLKVMILYFKSINDEEGKRMCENELEARRLDEYHTDLMNTAWDYI